MKRPKWVAGRWHEEACSTAGISLPAVSLTRGDPFGGPGETVADKVYVFCDTKQSEWQARPVSIAQPSDRTRSGSSTGERSLNDGLVHYCEPPFLLLVGILAL